MIGMLKGTVWTVEAERVVLDVQGVGYLLYVPSGYLTSMKPGEERIFYTHLLVREDDLTLIGFHHRDERDLFLQLLGVTGIGPKAALSILSAFPVKQIKSAIIREDASLLTEVPGIGSKIAKRLILELKEKIKDTDSDSPAPDQESFSGNTNEALDTLLVLGFSRNEAREALSKAEEKGVQSTEDRIKEALRLLAKER
ncbi:MAG: Holliday junction ATP-dependent DNA helicase RuvA [Candidatus Dichloromethanomonas elyunquensis]|nr:MAG: Holliday junction ATP-dependent DNA helicase RuvA [Candidatus Dichloromethanomonas elyunquensis]